MANTYTAVELSVDVDGEKKELLTLLADQRALLRITARNLTEEQARALPTVSELSIGGLLKHVALVERNHVRTITERDENAQFDMSDAENGYVLRDDESLQGWLDEYATIAAEYEKLIAATDLDDSIPQATAPWAPEREWLTVRTMALHLLRETAHHSGHADIIRETLDGQTTMSALSEGQDWAAEVSGADAAS